MGGVRGLLERSADEEERNQRHGISGEVREDSRQDADRSNILITMIFIDD